MKREMRKIKTNLEGIRKMSRLPGAVVVIDAVKEYIALAEAKKLGIITVGVIDTDSNPDMIDVAIPANDDSIRAIELILGELTDAVAAGKTMVASTEQKETHPRRARSRRSVLARAHPSDSESESADEAKHSEPVESASQQEGTKEKGSE